MRMDEAKWLTAKYAGGMIWSLFSRSAGNGRIKDQRYRRFGIACTRRALAALPGGTCPALDLLEASISALSLDVLANVRKLLATQLKASPDEPFGERARQFAMEAVLKCAKSKPTLAAMAHEQALAAVVAMRGHEQGWEPTGAWPRKPRQAKVENAEQAAQAALVRDIFGNPFQAPPTFAPDWRTDTAVAIARQMFESRDFSAMPILADALQDAGCDNELILSHCRDTAHPHARGCWVVDLVLNKP